MPRIAVTGASGLIGSALVTFLRGQGHSVVPVSRRDAVTPDVVHWDPGRGILDARALDGVDAIVHLAGERVDERWTASHKRAILESRISGTTLIAQVAAAICPRPQVLILASAVGYYGDRGDAVVDEETGPGVGFLATVVRKWEAAAEPARAAGIRTVHTRFGLVLHRSGGALARLLPPFELGAGGKIAHGTQWMSWIARDDAISAISFALTTPSLHGPVNVTAPNPVTNSEFAKTLGRVLHRPAFATIPAFAVRLIYGELADEALLAGQRVLPHALERSGFAFQYPALEPALVHELRKD